MPGTRWVTRAKGHIKACFDVVPLGRDLYLAFAARSSHLSFRGVFDDPEAARRGITKTKAGNYDVVNEAKSQNEARERQSLDTWFHSEDYPLLFWLSRFLRPGTKVVELGGSVGHFFYSMQAYYPCGEDLRWVIAELPAAVQLGRRFAEERGEKRLSFMESTRLDEVEESDVFLTAGTLQYMDTPLWELAGRAKLPPQVLVHNLPCHSDKTFWTLQRLELCEVPYRVYSKAELLARMSELGYRLRAEWRTPRDIEIPFHRDIQIEGYLGFAFVR